MRYRITAVHSDGYRRCLCVCDESEREFVLLKWTANKEYHNVRADPIGTIRIVLKGTGFLAPVMIRMDADGREVDPPTAIEFPYASHVGGGVARYVCDELNRGWPERDCDRIYRRETIAGTQSDADETS